MKELEELREMKEVGTLTRKTREGGITVLLPNDIEDIHKFLLSQYCPNLIESPSLLAAWLSQPMMIASLHV
jgi:hypothetical protein